MIDSHGREIDYLRLSVTDLCNLRCLYCMPKGVIPKRSHEEIMTFEEIEIVVKALAGLGIKKLRITGGEPLVRRGVIHLIEKLKRLEGIDEIDITTNGMLLEKYALDLKRAGISRVNISLDTLNADRYKKLTQGGDLKDVIAGISAAKENNLTPIKINSVLMKTTSAEEVREFADFAAEHDLEVRFIELMPLGETAEFAKDNYKEGSYILEILKDRLEDEIPRGSSPAQVFNLRGNRGKIGIISPLSCNFCSECNRLRLTSDGKLRTCLHSNNDLDLKKHLRSGIDIYELLKSAILNKEKEHKIESDIYSLKNMNRIGG